MTAQRMMAEHPTYNQLTTRAVVVAAESQVHRRAGDETLVLDIGRGRYYSLSGVGTRIWELIGKPTRVAELRDTLVAEFDIDPERCESDLFDYLRELEAEGLVEIHG